MRTVGEILKEERERKFYSLEDIEKVTKIRKELLEALEKSEWNKLPPPTFIQGFIRNYGKFLKLDIEKLLAIFRREYSDNINPPKVLQSLVKPVGNKFHITPARLISSVVVILIISFFTYLWFEYRYLVGAPQLSVDSPSDQAVITSDFAHLTGKTSPEAKVSINNQEVTLSDNGDFTTDIKLQDGMNKIVIISTSRLGASAEVDRVVFKR